MRPFFSYFGGKWTLTPEYPLPEHDIIVEPFAGSAGYATRYADRQVILVEKAPFLAALWRWLIGVSVDEVLALPLDFHRLEGLREEARMLVLFWCARGRVRPRSISPWISNPKWRRSFWGEASRLRVAKQVEQIRHWQVIEGDYSQAPDVKATWFVDPPYVGARHYLARVEDYNALGSWCRSREGLTVVCEMGKADWLPFHPFRTMRNISRSDYKELVYVQRDGAQVTLPNTVEQIDLFGGTDA